MREFFGRPQSAHIIVRDGDRVLFLKRSGEWRTGKFCLPTGHVEGGETIRQAAQRELKEETGLDVAVDDLLFAHVIHRAPEHNGDAEYVDFYFEARNTKGDAVNAEPHKHSELAWLNIEDEDPDIFVDHVLAALHAVQYGEHYSERGWE